MKRYLVGLILLVVAISLVGCTVNTSKDKQAVQTRYATLSSNTAPSTCYPFLANEVSFEVAVNVFGFSYDSTVKVSQDQFISDFRTLHVNPAESLVGVTIDLNNASFSWSDVVVSVNGTEATATRSYSITYKSSSGTVTGMGTTQTFWTKVDQEWKLYRFRHTSTWTK